MCASTKDSRGCMMFSEATQGLIKRPNQSGAAQSAAIAVQTSEHIETGVLTTRTDHLPFPVEAAFALYSVTKTVLATVALTLVERHVLTLDGPIARWLPHAPHADQITLRHLLRHASGLPDYGGLASYHEAVRRGEHPWSDDEFLHATQVQALLYPPGLGWHYSNIGYMIVRQLLEAVQAAPLAAIVQSIICAPLGLRATTVLTSDAQLQSLTFGLSPALGTAEHPGNVAQHYHVGWVAHGVVASTMQETAQFVDALFAGHLLSPALLREMTTFSPLPVMPDRPWVRPGYGMGIQIDHGWPAGPLYGHSGEGPGAVICVMSLRNHRRPVTIAVAAPGEAIAQVEAITLQILSEQDV
jgi:D-alanyl-D-alanine carboxypeptidase